MTIRDLVPASELAKRFGTKAVGYGPPGVGKTPFIDSAADLNPVMCVTEPGMLSMAKSKIACFPAFTSKLVDEFVDWYVGSAEAKQFGLGAIDSVSQMAENDLMELKSSTTNLMKVYGQLEERVMRRMHKLYYAPERHIILIAKEAKGDGSKDGSPTSMTSPLFPGQALNARIPHLFDWVFRLEYATINGIRTRAVRSLPSHEYFARERTGRLAEHEPPNLSYLIQKLTA